MANLKILNHRMMPYDTGVREDRATEVIVTIVSGDERLIILTDYGKIYEIYADKFYEKPEGVNVFERTYIVHRDLIPLWNRRATTNWDPDVEVFDYVS